MVEKVVIDFADFGDFRLEFFFEGQYQVEFIHFGNDSDTLAFTHDRNKAESVFNACLTVLSTVIDA